MIGFPPLIVMIHKFSLACVGSRLLAGEFGVVSAIYRVVKSSSSSKLKPTFFPKGVKPISNVRIVV